MFSGLFVQILFFDSILSKPKIPILFRTVYDVSKVENSLLDIIYFQLLVWSGYFFCPALIFIGFFYLLIMYALMTWSALYNFSFDEEGAISAYREKVLKSFELWNPKNDEIDQQKRATEIRTKTKRIKTTIKTQHQRQKALLLYDRDYFFYYTLGVGFLVSFIVVLFSIVSVDSSYWCGPFGFENQYNPNVDGSADASISIVDTVKFYTNENAVLGIWRNSRFNFGLTLILIYVFWFVNGLGKNRQGTVEDIKARYLRK